MDEKRVNCLKCKHYFSTYDPLTPRGCNLYGFRSKDFPSTVVKKESGSECQAFEQRKRVEKENPYE